MTAVASFQEIRRLRRSGLITLTLTDLLIVVVFVLLLFTFRASEEGLAEISAEKALVQELKAELARLNLELAEASHENERLRQEVRDLKEFVQRLLGRSQDPTLPADPTPADTIARLEVENRELRETIERQKEEIEQLRTQIETRGQKPRQDGSQSHAKGGSGYPRCPATAGFLLEIGLLGSGNLAVAPRWGAAEGDVQAVPGVFELVSAGEVSLDSFSQLADHILVWSNSQKPPCRFHVDTRRETDDLSTYLRQMSVIDRYFYPKRP